MKASLKRVSGRLGLSCNASFRHFVAARSRRNLDDLHAIVILVSARHRSRDYARRGQDSRHGSDFNFGDIHAVVVGFGDLFKLGLVPFRPTAPAWIALLA